MHFNKRHLSRRKGVAQGDACVCEAAWIQHDKVAASNLACLDLPYQLMLGIALKGFELMALLPGKLDQFLI